MYMRKVQGPGHVTLPDGTKMTRADLRRPNRRWVARRKAAVVVRWITG